MKIFANTIVNNEENFIWFAIMSVVDYVDKVLVYDTGSTDHTLEIIKEIAKIKRDKIEFKELGPVDKDEFTRLRQKMLDESNCDWILVLDGDEIWWEESIKRIYEEIDKNGDKVEGIVVPMVVPVGDIYHLQDHSAGRYEIAGKKGHYSLKAINKKISGLHVSNPYGQEGYFDGNNTPIQKKEGIILIDTPILHVTHLKRSSSKEKQNKFKYEIGKMVKSNFKFPEVFYKEYPAVIPSPWIKVSGVTAIKASLLTPLRMFKRKLLN